MSEPSTSTGFPEQTSVDVGSSSQGTDEGYETIVADVRADLTPGQLIEGKLEGQLQSQPLPVGRMPSRRGRDTESMPMNRIEQ